jgi:hypothetical protein
MLDEIRTRCKLLLSTDYVDHSAAYVWLRQCKPFHRVVDRFRDHGMNMFDVAAMLLVGSARPLAPDALKMLAEEVVADAD